ncbi:hypothetical protein [Streptosporangium sp. NPDC001681]|uniref:hypothetical protein n=1 Tax=Streptosporangium sp. NPDC001681 TaxID=3154395 RepID=UPI003323DE10
MHGDVYKETAPIERKVTAATAASYLSLVGVLAILQTAQADLDLIAWMPDAIETLAVPLLPGLVTYVAGYLAKHTARPDLPDEQR